MSPIVFAAALSILVYLVAVALIPRRLLEGPSVHTRHMVDRLRAEQGRAHGMEEMQEDPATNPLARAFLIIPGAQYAVPLIQKAGLWAAVDRFMLGLLLVFLFMLMVLARFGPAGIPLALIATWAVGWLYLRWCVSKRQRAFIAQFPEALDSIVRSVRAGYSLSNAIGMVADNMPAPIGVEFRRVADEASFGFTLSEALNRMAERVNEPDVRFFTVVLSVQQETGGNLSESLSNLSKLIRKRKQMRMRIKALSSEGRATMWILGSLPLFVYLVLRFTSPDHLTPLYTTSMGHWMIAAVFIMVGAGMLIVRQMINMEV